MKLEDWRREIDEIDGEIVRLIARRAQVARRIGLLKRAVGLPVVDAGREEEIMSNLAARNPGVLSDEALQRIFRGIIRESRALQAESGRKPAATGEWL